ncbi:MAG TPA: hypothetical protein VL049_02785 [Candidatus Dormibacteraeota bacterium]|nr:hypothetical protein [Candidatus Dormibacteraeota bacterium]
MTRAYAMLAMAALAGSLGTDRIVPAPGAAGRPNVCRMTSQTMLQACQAAATQDQAVAQAQCENYHDAAVRKVCRQAAAAAVKDARQSCKDQLAARQDVCDQLGPLPYGPVIDPANFGGAINNPYFPLVPGTTFVYESHTAQGLERDEFAVTHNTKVILGVTCVEVHDVATLNGDPTQDRLDWFAQDLAGNVWSFGENSKQIAGGLVVGVEGSWTGGIDGAKPGIVMEAHPALGDVYRQEFSLGVAEDIGAVLSLSESVSVSYGTLANCLETADTSPLEPDALEHRYYAAGVGNLRTVDLQTGETEDLVQITGP